jgi:hypothetical protein
MECESRRNAPLGCDYDVNLLRVVLMNYREDGTTPFVTVWKHGLTAMKV